MKEKIEHINDLTDKKQTKRHGETEQNIDNIFATYFSLENCPETLTKIAGKDLTAMLAAEETTAFQMPRKLEHIIGWKSSCVLTSNKCDEKPV